jgi:hypothetical protein
MIIYRKNQTVRTEEQANNLLDAQDDFVNNPGSERPAPTLDPILRIIWNGGERQEWEWSDETSREYTRRIAQEKAEEAKIEGYKADLELWKNEVVRPCRDRRLNIWIDITYIRGKQYEAMTEAEKVERDTKYQELLDWPDTITEYKADAELELLKPSAPSYLI